MRELPAHEAQILSEASEVVLDQKAGDLFEAHEPEILRKVYYSGNRPDDKDKVQEGLDFSNF